MLTDIEIQNLESEIIRAKKQLAETDYLALKAFEGEDMSQYGNWQKDRHDLRVKINENEAIINANKNNLTLFD